MVVRKFSIVQKGFSSNFLSTVYIYIWFGHEVGLCVAAALYLWERRNFVWLFEENRDYGRRDPLR
jgi:hypothetical protein